MKNKKSARENADTKMLYDNYIRFSGNSQTETQAKKILRYMIANGSITADEAYKRGYGMRLSARIADLRAAGIPITTELEPNKDKGNHARYRLEV